MTKNLRKALEYIQGYCEKNSRCDSCQLHNEDKGGCLIRDNIPINWEIEKWANKES